MFFNPLCCYLLIFAFNQSQTKLLQKLLFLRLPETLRHLAHKKTRLGHAQIGYLLSYNWLWLGESPACHHQSTLSCWENFPTKIQNSDPPANWTNKLCLSYLSEFSLTLDIKTKWFGCQMAVCVKGRHTNAIFGCSQKFNFGS